MKHRFQLSTYGHDLLDFHDIFDGDELIVSTGTVCSLHSGQVFCYCRCEDLLELQTRKACADGEALETGDSGALLYAAAAEILPFRCKFVIQTRVLRGSVPRLNYQY